MERLFTYDEANDLVPWLEERFAAIAPMRNELVDRQETLLSLLRRRRSNGHSSSEQEIADAENVVTRLTRQLQDAVKEITDRGIEVRDIGRGLVDFPHNREGRNGVPVLAARRTLHRLVAPHQHRLRRPPPSLATAASPNATLASQRLHW